MANGQQGVSLRQPFIRYSLLAVPPALFVTPYPFRHAAAPILRRIAMNPSHDEWAVCARQPTRFPMRHVTFRRLSRPLAAIGALLFVGLAGAPAAAQLAITPGDVATNVGISWEVKNRFRLFRDAKDFTRHVAVTGAGVSWPPSRRSRRRPRAAAGRATWWPGCASTAPAASSRLASATGCANLISLRSTIRCRSGFWARSRPTRPVGGRSTMAKARPRP